MRPRFLFGGTEVPSLGGASTALYDLFARMQRDGHDVHLVNLLHEDDQAFLAYTFGDGGGNPVGLPGVSTSWLVGDPVKPQPALEALIESVQPDVLVGMGYYASLLFKLAAPQRTTVMITGSCSAAARMVTSGKAPDAITLQQRLASGALLPGLDQGERNAVLRCDLIVTHSRQTKEFMQACYPTSIGFIYEDVVSFAEWICDGAAPWQHKARPFHERDIGVVFVTTDWNREVKNRPLLEALARRLDGVSVHVVGDVTSPIPGVVHHGLVPSRELLFDLIGRARCVACPSLIDAAPGILWEGSMLGCNVVASRNCGNWEMCHPDLLVDPFGVEGFVTCIRRAQERKYDDRLDAFLAMRGYDELVRLLHAITRPIVSIVS